MRGKRLSEHDLVSTIYHYRDNNHVSVRGLAQSLGLAYSTVKGVLRRIGVTIRQNKSLLGRRKKTTQV